MNKFEKAYHLTDDDLGCPEDCEYCEKNSTLQYIPRELEFISRKFKTPKKELATSYKSNGHILWQINQGAESCLFCKDRRCTKREIRALDCKSYPVIPYLKNGKIFVELDKNVL